MIRLSASTLNIFTNNERCFWKEKNGKVKRPEGIFSSLPNGLDLMFKEHFDGVRGTLPTELLDCPELDGYVLFEDTEKLKKWRHWASGLKVKNDDGEWELIGAIDDVLYNKGKNLYIPLDYKTKGKEPDEGYGMKYYQTNMNVYDYMFIMNKLPTPGFGVLLFFYPEMYLGKDQPGLIDFGTTIQVIQTYPDVLKKLCDQAAACLRGPIPAPDPLNEYDSYIEKSLNF